MYVNIHVCNVYYMYVWVINMCIIRIIVCKVHLLVLYVCIFNHLQRYTMASETLHRMLKIDDPSFITDQDKVKQ